MSFFQNNQNAIGLDISDLTLRAVQFKGQGRGLAFEGYGQIDVPPGIIKNGEILEPRTVSDLIKRMISRPSFGRFSTKNVIASLPERRSFIKALEIPQIDSQQLEVTIRQEMSQHVPFSADEIYLDWQMFKSGASADTSRVLIGATPKSIVDSYIAALEDADLRPVSLVIESMAIAYALIPPNAEKNTSAMILDIGLNRTSFLVFDQGAVRFSASSKVISGSAMTRLIAQKLNLTNDQAEEAKRLCGLDPTQGKAVIPKTLMPAIDQLAKQIEKFLQFYKTHVPQANEISQIILAGGGANLKNLTKVLSERLGRKVVLGNPWCQFEHLQKTKVIPSQQYLSQPTSFGLGLLGLANLSRKKK
ncbi:MAG: type IV pilus assembly protein PilM [Patescibacteria group bacterium]|nr:type IV pilus assembly protein PilM [Patescibacteria group bacterium]